MAYHFKFLRPSLFCAPICLHCLSSLLQKTSGNAAIHCNNWLINSLWTLVCTKINYVLRSVHTFHARSNLWKILFETNLVTRSELSRKSNSQSGRVHALALNNRLFLRPMAPIHFTIQDHRGKTIDSLQYYHLCNRYFTGIFLLTEWNFRESNANPYTLRKYQDDLLSGNDAELRPLSPLWSFLDTRRLNFEARESFENDSQEAVPHPRLCTIYSYACQRDVRS